MIWKEKVATLGTTGTQVSGKENGKTSKYIRGCIQAISVA